MTVMDLAMNTVRLLGDQVAFIQVFAEIQQSNSNQVSMMDRDQNRRLFSQLTLKDRDLTMFTVTNLTLTKKDTGNMVYMALKLKRKVATELLTTYLPTVLLLLITFVTIFFDKDLFADAIAVNLTIMLVMTTIFTSKIEELPPTSDMKMIDIWLIFCLVVPFLEVILRTAIECLNCSCHICEKGDADKTKDRKEDKKKEATARKGVASGGEVPRIWFRSGAKVVPQQVCYLLFFLLRYLFSEVPSQAP